MNIPCTHSAARVIAGLPRQKKLEAEDVLSVICDYYKIRIDDLRSRCRLNKIVVPRQIASYILCHTMNMSKAEIGRMFCQGRPNVSLAVKHVQEQLSLRFDTRIKNDLKIINQIIEDEYRK